MRLALITVGSLLFALSCERPRPVVFAEDARRAATRADADAEPTASIDRSFVDVLLPLDAALEESEEAPDAAPVNRDDPYAYSCDRPIEDRSPMPSIPLPEVPPALRAEVTRLRPLVAKCMRCFDAERVEHVRQVDCGQWAAQLRDSGLAGMHAVGQFAVDEQHGRLSRGERALTEVEIRFGGMPEVRRGGGNTIDSANVIAPLLSSFEAREALPYMLAAINRYVYCRFPRPAEADRLEAWAEAISSFVGFDPDPLPQWQDEPATYERRAERAYDVLSRWIRWYGPRQNQTLEQWRAYALERNRRALTSPLVAVRVAAIERLSDERAAPEDREAARQTLVRLLENRRVPNGAKRFLRGHAARVGWSIDGDAQDGGLAPGAGARDG